jgi:protein-disulfide isomerase
VGRNRRRGSGQRSRGAGEPRPPASTVPPASPVAVKTGWRAQLESWGGFTVLGSIVAAVVVVGLLVYFNRPGSGQSNDPYTLIPRDNVSQKTWGKAEAPVKIIEFADFQCPFCRQFTRDTEQQLAAEFIQSGDVQLIFHHFAFLGPESGRAAEAAECAADQNHFWDYHDLLYLRQGSENTGVFSPENLKSFAKELNKAFPEFNVDTFGSCLDSGRKRAAVDLETAQARDAGVSSTPTFLINGKLVTGAQTIDVFRQAIAQAKAPK